MRLRFWRRHPDYARIAELERDCGMDEDSLAAAVERARQENLASLKKKRWQVFRPPVLDRTPLQTIADFHFAPGQRWQVASPDDVRPFNPATSVCVSGYASVDLYKPSRVVLPDDVSVS